jgi:hypothetical protein
MTTPQARQLATCLAARGVCLASGLSTSEIAQLTTSFGIFFPPDLLLLLQVALPVSPGFTPWRDALHSPAGARALQARLAAPLEGLLFDVKLNGFWLIEWGPKPAEAAAREQLVRQQYAHYPRLLPLYSHRYLPASPPLAGNPVFSVYQTDIIYYGYDLAHYLATEFNFALPAGFAPLTAPQNQIMFWDALIS